jgi:hypothetical protein
MLLKDLFIPLIDTKGILIVRTQEAISRSSFAKLEYLGLVTEFIYHFELMVVFVQLEVKDGVV